uniref:Crystaline entomocidal protoxin n=1 Tax=Bacillus thuringiensis TaxID=1428 RepID=U5KRN4_BACTU|nr:pesticidal protein [Bacillus thuringiensis]
MNINDNKDEFEIMGNGSMVYQPRYPLAQAPGSEFQGMNYKDWMNRCANGELGELFVDSDAVRNGIVAGLGVTSFVLSIGFPAAAAAVGIISVLLPLLWPDQAGPPGTTEAQFTWDQWITAGEELAAQTVSTSVKDRAIDTTRILQSRMRDYQQAICNLQTDPDNEEYKADVRREFNDAEDQAKDAVIQFGNLNYAIPLLADYAEAANLHLLLLRDVVKFGEIWGFTALQVQQYYSNTGVGNPGMKQLLATYTDHCVRYYKEGLEKRYATGNWNAFNDYRRTMTIMVMDIVSLWPTYDSRVYTLPTKSQLTRTVYTPFVLSYPTPNLPLISEIESQVVVPPSLFSWLFLIESYTEKAAQDKECLTGQRQAFAYTTGRDLFQEFKGNLNGTYRGQLVAEPGLGQYVWAIELYGSGYLWDGYPYLHNLGFFNFKLTNSEDQKIHVSPGDIVDGTTAILGLPCKPNNNDCDPCNPCNTLPINLSNPCNDISLYSHRFSYLGTYPAPPVNNWSPTNIGNFSFGWTHISADYENQIDAEKITQIPAVKADGMGSTVKIIKGDGSTGGDLVQLGQGPSHATFLKIPMGGIAQKGYQLRIRYALSAREDSELVVERLVGNRGDMVRDYYASTWMTPTYSGDPLQVNYDSFGYATFESLLPPTPYSNWELIFAGDTALIDKIEFIPIEGSVEEFEANQALEKARKAVNALFTNDAKNALQLKVTDYAVDQAANLAECVSDEFHAQEKMILLNQVKFAKRLSHVRNLLNHGDFELSDWSSENGWKTSPHVHVVSNNPIFKGRYLHMPEATSSHFSSNTYPTYVYQKVDESKLKSYTRYLVRGFVGNSKNLELLVERYGKDVHVEMNVPNDIQYSLPMNECGGFNRCKPASYQARPLHTCTCNDTAVTHTNCQCKDKGNRNSTNMYTNAPTDSAVYRNGSHDHKSCGCKNNDMYQSGTHPHKSCGCKDPHVFTYHIDTGCVDQEENLGLWFALKIASENGVANIDNLEIIEAQPLTGEALARVKKREHKWKQEMAQKRLHTEKSVQAAQTAIQNLFTNTQYNRLKFETLFPHIVHADLLVQQIPYVYHDYLLGSIPPVPGMNYEMYQQLSVKIGNAHALYEQRNLVRNGTFSSGTGSWHVTEGVEVQPLQNTSVLVLSEWNHEASQQLRIDPDRGYVLRVTARKEGSGKGTVTMSDCADYTETLTFTSCDYNTIGTQTMTGGTLSGFVTKTLEIFPDTDRIRIDIGETEGTFKIESVELICMEQMENHLYDMAGNLEEEMLDLQSARSGSSTLDHICSTLIGDFGC